MHKLYTGNQVLHKFINFKRLFGVDPSNRRFFWGNNTDHKSNKVDQYLYVQHEERIQKPPIRIYVSIKRGSSSNGT